MGSLFSTVYTKGTVSCLKKAAASGAAGNDQALPELGFRSLQYSLIISRKSLACCGR